MRSPAPHHPAPAAGNNYSPSVPISIYRELAAELQATRAMLDSLNMQNQQLLKQNQQLRTEIEKVVQGALQMRQVADAFQPIDWVAVAEPTPLRVETMAEPPRSTIVAPRPTQRPVAAKPTPLEPTNPPEKLFTEQEPAPRRHPQAEKSGGEISGLWLGLLIGLIIVTAFGAGFLIVRPFLPTGK